MRMGLIADCHSELKEYKKAVEKYVEASEVDANEFTTPMFLFKAGLNSEKVNDFKKAAEYYTKVRDEYPGSASQITVDKYVARASGKVVK
jgi:TolA-binding protein